jgi:hypothetical protein
MSNGCGLPPFATPIDEIQSTTIEPVDLVDTLFDQVSHP